jgi:hypothetical protein
MEASVRSFSREEVLRTLVALKLALSRTIRVVESEMALRVRDHKIRRVQRVAFAIQRRDLFSGLGRPNEDGFSVQLGGIEGVHWLGNFRHHEIGDVDDVVDGVQADGFQSLRKPRGRRLDGYVLKNQRGITRTQFEVLNIDVDGARAIERARLHRVNQRLSTDSGDFAGHSVVAPQVRTMRQRLVIHLDDGIRAVNLHAFALGSLESDEAGEFGRRHIQPFHEITQPMVRKLHGSELIQETQIAAHE